MPAMSSTREEIEKVLRLRAPKLLPTVPRLMQKWKGKEDVLLRKLRTKYIGRDQIRSTSDLLKDYPSSPTKMRKQNMMSRAKSMSCLSPNKRLENNFIDAVERKQTETEMVFHSKAGPRPAERSRKIYDSCGSQIDSTKHSQPIVVFKTQSRKALNEVENQNFPGPGAYKQQVYVGGYKPDSTIESAPEPTMGGREVFGSTVDYTEAKNTPGPQNYIPRNPEWDKERRAPSYSLYDRNYVRTQAEKNPGPGEYLSGNMTKHLDVVKTKPWGVPFVKQRRDRDAIYIPVNKQRDETPCGPGEYGQGVEMTKGQFESRYKGQANACFGRCPRDKPDVDPVALAAKQGSSEGPKLWVSSIGEQVDSTKRTAPKASMSGRNWFGDTNNVSELFNKLGRMGQMTDINRTRRTPLR